MKTLIAALAFLTVFAGFAQASEFKDVTKIDDPRGIIWHYTFNVSTDKIGLSTPLLVDEPSCIKIHHIKDSIRLHLERITDDPKWVCYETEDKARIVAQKEADDFEDKLKKEGTSTTKIEAWRLSKKVLP